VVHAVSAFYVRSDHMSPVAALLAALLHAATALALYLISPLARHDIDDGAAPPITITFEESKPAAPPPVQAPPSAPAPTPAPAPPPPPAAAPAAEAAPPPPSPPAMAAKPEPKPEPKPKPEPPPKPQQQAASKERAGIEPPAPPASEPPKQQEAPKQEATLEPQKPPEAKPAEVESAETKAAETKVAEPKPTETKATETKPAEPAPPPTETAAAAPPPEAPPPKPEPPLEKAVPPVEAPAAPLSMRDFVKVMPPPPPPPAARPQPAPRPHPPPEQHPPPQHPPQTLQRSPLSTGQAPSRGSSSASISTFTNPAASSASSRAKNAYLARVLRKFSQYLPNLREKNEGGTVTMRFVIARDGRLVDASIVKSSGVIALDKGLLEALRVASPYGPMPAEITESQVIFVQSIEARR
jgi:TonB family protein